MAFIDDMARRYAEADLVICRAGAVTIAELSAGGMASLLVPFPHAVDDHQTANAAWMADAGAATVIEDAEMSAARLDAELGALLGDEARMEAMSVASAALARPDAARRIADEVLNAARGHG